MKGIKAQTLRTIAILLVAIVVVIGLVTNGAIGNLSDLGYRTIAAICPLGYLETLLASKLFIPQALVAFLLVIVAIFVLGRVFCAWICPVSLIQRWFPGRRKKAAELKDQIEIVTAQAHEFEAVGAEAIAAGTAVGAVVEPAAALTVAQAEADGCSPSACESCGTATKTLCGHSKPNNFKFDSRHVVLGGSLLSAAIFGFPVFCLVCPVGLSFATILLVMRLFSVGDVTLSLLVFPAILILELLVFRKWCNKICPLGALVSLVSSANRFFRVKVDDKKCLVSTQGIECTVCQKACTRENIDPRRPGESVGALADCTKCRDCADACPAGAISFPLLPSKQKENA